VFAKLLRRLINWKGDLVACQCVQVMLVSLSLCLPSATTSDVTLFGTV